VACIQLDKGLVNKASLISLEPFVNVIIDSSGEFGRLVAKVKLTPDAVTQFHEFQYPINSMNVRLLIGSLERVLCVFAIRG
jgi:hypothetical protein